MKQTPDRVLPILYVGETKDFSDRWLVASIKKKYPLKIFDIALEGNKNPDPDRQYAIVINRLYTSAKSRVGDKQIACVLKILRQLQQRKTPFLNSISGYLLDLNRLKQFHYFTKRNIPYIKTVRASLSSVHSLPRKLFPFLLKQNFASGRNTKLLLIKNYKDITKIPASIRQQSVLQPLIKKSMCYRTEFIGDWSSTFLQKIILEETHIKSIQTKRFLRDPFSDMFRKKLLLIMNKLGVQAFSLEYFLDQKNNLSIIDFNLTSNYHPFFIAKNEPLLRRAWINTTNNQF